MIYLLIGQKGSGKTFIGGLFDEYFNIKFVRVEDWAKKIKRDKAIDDEGYLRKVFNIIESGIRSTLKEYDSIVFESTGLTDHFDKMLYDLQSDFKVITISIIAESKECLERIKSRDQSIHINVSDEQVNKINEAVIVKNIPTDFVIINSNKTESNLKEEIANIIKKNK